jgi:hypothetical protein
MTGSRSFVEDWRRYRRWARLRWVAFLGYLPFGIAYSKLHEYLGLTGPPIPVLAWFVFFGVTMAMTGFFGCPRCESPFFFTWYWSNPFARQCLHCGLPKWSASDPDRAS